MTSTVDNVTARPLDATSRCRGERNFTARDKANLEEIFGVPIEYLLERDNF